MANCNVREMLHVLTIEGNAIVNPSLFYTKKFKGNFHLSLKSKSQQHIQYTWNLMSCCRKSQHFHSAPYEMS